MKDRISDLENTIVKIVEDNTSKIHKLEDELYKRDDEELKRKHITKSYIPENEDEPESKT